ncbi:MAG TPA: hypothetical protein VFF06_01250 [Polyangia bacterium]|nr:hypothetical protein [Polyangia bacterium]
MRGARYRPWLIALVAVGALHAFLHHPSVIRREHHARPRPMAVLAHSLGAPPYDAVYGSATHNSYWVNRDDGPETEASGTEERILDQLFHDHVRALEFDVHFAAGRPGVWSVYHTDRERNSLCSPLDQCLEQLALFQHLAPEHEVVNVVIELKELWTHVFWPDHSIAQFDALLRRYLGRALYTPAEFLARCAGGATLRECARDVGWPATDELRGKFIVNVIGNWNYDANDWIDYAASGGGVAERAAFPMRTILDDSGSGLSGPLAYPIHDPIDRDAEARARDASIFWQVEDLDYPEVDAFLDEHGVVRGRGSQSYSEQRDRIASGFQLIQNDHPWHFVEDHALTPWSAALPTDPSRRLREAAGAGGRPSPALIEPGARLYLRGDGERFMTAGQRNAAAQNNARADEWETYPSMARPRSTTRFGLDVSAWRWDYDAFDGPARARGVGCLRAASASEHFMVCRQVVSGEESRVTVHVGRAGDRHESVRKFEAGELLALRVSTGGGKSCAVASTALRMNGGTPAWIPIATECFSTSLDEQGLAATRDVLFVGTRHDGRYVTAHDLPLHSATGALVDLSYSPSVEPNTPPILTQQKPR